jgi:hypothetical protein
MSTNNNAVRKIQAVTNAKTKRNAAKTASNTANALVVTSETALRELREAIAALEVDAAAGNKASQQKAAVAKEVLGEVQKLKDQLDSFGNLVGADQFLESEFSFVKKNNNSNRSINTANANETLEILKTFETSISANKLAGGARSGYPTRKDMIEALLTGITKTAENLEQTAKDGKSAGNLAIIAKKQEEKEKVAKLNQNKENANKAKSNLAAKEESMTAVSNNAIKTLNQRLANLTTKVRNLAKKSPVEAGAAAPAAPTPSFANKVKMGD